MSPAETVPAGNLRGGLVVVTGAAGGVGQAIVESLLGAGAQVVGVDLTEPAQPPLDGYHHVVGDVTDGDVLAATFDLAGRLAAPLTGLVTCTIAQHRARLEELGADDFGAAFGVMTTAAWRWGVELARRTARPGAAIVHVSSVHGLRTAAGFAAYAAAKAALQSLTRSMAVEWGPRGIRCNAVLPGFVPVLRNRSVWDDPDALGRISARTPLGRPITGVEVAATVKFLLSAESSAITGACVPVDGGLLAHLGLGGS